MKEAGKPENNKKLIVYKGIDPMKEFPIECFLQDPKIVEDFLRKIPKRAKSKDIITVIEKEFLAGQNEGRSYADEDGQNVRLLTSDKEFFNKKISCYYFKFLQCDGGEREHIHQAPRYVMIVTGDKSSKMRYMCTDLKKMQKEKIIAEQKQHIANGQFGIPILCLDNMNTEEITFPANTVNFVRIPCWALHAFEENAGNKTSACYISLHEADEIEGENLCIPVASLDFFMGASIYLSADPRASLKR